MLKYLENSEDQKAGHREPKEQLETTEEAGFFHYANCPTGKE